MSATKTEVQIQAGTYRVDPLHSSVGFAVKHLGIATFKGEFGTFDATLNVSEDGSLRLEGSGDVTSIKTGEAALDGHLASPEFFDAERHPQVRFSAEDVQVDGNALEAAGELSIRGVARPVTIGGTISEPITDMGGNQRVAVELEAEVDRTDYGLDWNAELPGGGEALAHAVHLVANLELVKDA